MSFFGMTAVDVSHVNILSAGNPPWLWRVPGPLLAPVREAESNPRSA